MSAAASSPASLTPSTSVWQFSIAKAEERRDNCDYCEFSGARNYVNEVEERKRKRKERVEDWKYCNVRLSESSVHANLRTKRSIKAV